MIKITAEYGRKLEISDEQFALWLADLEEFQDERLYMPLHIGDRLAFTAPEMIRSAITTEFLRSKLP